ncbi:MAG: PleD family two-component system response regulator [Candidatus Aminicenantia bacterium]
MAYKIIVADDSNTTKKVAELAFAEKEFEVFSVSDGDEAINLIGQVKPEIVLLDVKLPNKNGYEVCQYINNNFSEISVIFLKGAFETIDREIVKDLIYEDIIQKPFDSAQLVNKVKETLEKKMSPEIAAEEVPEKEAAPEEEALKEKEEEMVNPFLDTKEEEEIAKEKKEDIGLPEDIKEIKKETVEPSVSEEMINQITEKIVKQLSPEVVKKIAQKIVPQIAEKLIKKEIEKIKKEVKSISS